MNAEDLVFENEERPYYQIQLVYKTPEKVIDSRYHYKIKPMQRIETLIVGLELHNKIQSLLTVCESKNLILQRDENGNLCVGRAFVNWEALKAMTDGEKEQIYTDLRRLFPSV
jgi:hypothetical protein